MIKRLSKGGNAMIDECPFCKNTNQDEFYTGVNLGGLKSFYNVHCCSCGARGPDGKTMEEAVERWNKREAGK
jgi:Lar family restriction alleviation protein